MEDYAISVNRFNKYLEQNLNINMERGWPCSEQLDLSMPMLDTVNSKTNLICEVDYRGYDGTGGIAPLKELFADVLEVNMDEIYIGGTMSTTLMYDIVNKAVLFGLEGFEPWNKQEAKFICPSPGYEKHFNICKTFNIKMIPVPFLDDGPDMGVVEELVANDFSIKGMWCVPIYSNPTGTIYSDDVIRRLASMDAAPDFRLFWDNAYFVHHLTETEYHIANIIRECEKAGNPDRAFEFLSTSKITFPGGGVGLCASSKKNIDWIVRNSLLQLKTGDKINQMRHYLFFKDKNGLLIHMKKHGDIISRKFSIVDDVLSEELEGTDFAVWKMPLGGYFYNIRTKVGMAPLIYNKCREAGVRITPAGSTFPYGKDPDEACLRLAPTYLDNEDLEIAMRVLGLSIKIVTQEACK